MKNKHFLTLIILSIFLGSCATTSQFVKFTDNHSAIPNNKARIYVLRPASFKAGGVTIPVYCNNEIIGKTGSHSYLCWDVQEGTCKIASVTEESLRGGTVRKDFFTINAVAGKTYYLKMNPSIGAMGTVTLSPLSENEGKSILAGLKKPKLNYAE